MKLYLNDWAVIGREASFVENEAWDNFVQLVKELSNKCYLQKIVFPKLIASTIKKEVYALEASNESLRYKAFLSKFLERSDEEGLEGDRCICKGAGRDTPSYCLSMAYDEDMPVVSIVFTNTYKCDSFKAYLYSGLGDGRLVDIKNLYSGNEDKYIGDLSVCRPDRDVIPVNTPIWNIERTEKYIATLLDLEPMERKERMVHLLTEGREIARLNGWVEDKRLSCINSSEEKKRCIFRPEKFRHNDSAFLSIDFEKRAFELLDYAGRHLGEYSYLGEKRTGAKDNHGIKLKR